MSLVGPRRNGRNLCRSWNARSRATANVCASCPGLTGLAQVHLPPDTDIASVARKLQYDIYYLEYRTLWLEVRLIGVTAIHVAGVPFRWACRLAVLPDRERIEAAVTTT